MAGPSSANPPQDNRRLPETITAGGVTRWLTSHLRENPHPGVTADRIRHVLENWVVRGAYTNSEGNTTLTYRGFVPARRVMMRVPVSLDDEEIITATFDTRATRRINQEGHPWFQRHCQSLEVRNAS